MTRLMGICYHSAMNILLTSAGRRTYLVRYFKEAQTDGSLVFAANSTMSPALMEADGHVLTPLIYEEGYVDFLLDFCREHQIGLVIPLFDVDVWMLSCHRDRFLDAGIVPAVSDRSVTAVCSDKYMMGRRLSELGIHTPYTALDPEDYDGSFPAYVKPRFGMGSIGLYKALCREELDILWSLCKRNVEGSYLRYESKEKSEDQEGGGSVIIQSEVRGSEYGLDIINDLKGSYVTTIVRRKLAMRSGETDEAIVLSPEAPEHKVLSELGRRLGRGLGHRGNLDMDVILGAEDGVPYVLDMNARFGGGYPFSHAAGVDLPRAYVAWAKGEEVPGELLSVKRSIHAYKDMDIRLYEKQ